LGSVEADIPPKIKLYFCGGIILSEKTVAPSFDIAAFKKKNITYECVNG